MMKKFALAMLLLSLVAAGALMADAPILINAAGATFPYPIYSKWFDVYHKLHPDIQINYQSIGSGGGIRKSPRHRRFRRLRWAHERRSNQRLQAKRGVNVLHFPTVLGADVPTYNIPGVTRRLNFTPEALAGIFLGTITKWNDPEIAKANPGVKLRAPISWSSIAPTAAAPPISGPISFPKSARTGRTKSARGTSVNWPVGLGGKGNEGVAGLVKQTPDSIGYVELIYAVQNKMPYGKVQNAAGKFVKADLAGVTAAAAGAAKNMPDDFRVSITNAPGADGLSRSPASPGC